jgi:hypothetical protein
MLTLVRELIGHFDIQEKSRRVDLVGWARLFMFAGLEKIGTIAGAIERHFPLFAAALRANTPMNSGAKPLFLADFANRATQFRRLLFTLLHSSRFCVGTRQKPISA